MRLALVLVVQTVAAFPVIVQVPVPMVMVRVLELFEEKAAAVTLKLLASKVPWVRVRVLVAVKLSCKVYVPLAPFWVRAYKEIREKTPLGDKILKKLMEKGLI